MKENIYTSEQIADFEARPHSVKLIRRAPDSPNGNRRWVCECPKCGDKFSTHEYKIRMNYVQDCGCDPVILKMPIRHTMEDWEGEAAA